MSLPPKYQRLREAAEKLKIESERGENVDLDALSDALINFDNVVDYQALLDMLADYEKALERMSELEKHKRRLTDMFPLFVEARDALPAIPLAEAKLRGLDLTLADRVDAVGVLGQREATDAKAPGAIAMTEPTREELLKRCEEICNIAADVDWEDALILASALRTRLLEERAEIAWLVKGKGGYLTVPDEGLFCFDKDVNIAIRFARRMDAERVACLIGSDVERVVKHLWLYNPPLGEKTNC